MREYFINQFRSWKAMEDHFGISDPNAKYVNIEFPEEFKKRISEMVEAMRKVEAERIKLN